MRLLQRLRAPASRRPSRRSRSAPRPTARSCARPAAPAFVGVKPTLGLVSRDGVVPISAQQDTAGPMARHVVDAALTLAVIQGRDRADPATAEIPADQPRRYRLDRGGLARRPDRRLAAGRRRRGGRRDRRAARPGPPRRRRDRRRRSTLDDSVSSRTSSPRCWRSSSGTSTRTSPPRPGRHPATSPGLIAFNEADPVELRYFGQEIVPRRRRPAPPTDRPGDRGGPHAGDDDGARA